MSKQNLGQTLARPLAPSATHNWLSSLRNPRSLLPKQFGSLAPPTWSSTPCPARRPLKMASPSILKQAAQLSAQTNRLLSFYRNRTNKLYRCLKCNDLSRRTAVMTLLIQNCVTRISACPQLCVTQQTRILHVRPLPSQWRLRSQNRLRLKLRRRQQHQLPIMRASAPTAGWRKLLPWLLSHQELKSKRTCLNSRWSSRRHWCQKTTILCRQRPPILHLPQVARLQASVASLPVLKKSKRDLTSSKAPTTPLRIQSQTWKRMLTSWKASSCNQASRLRRPLSSLRMSKSNWMIWQMVPQI